MNTKIRKQMKQLTAESSKIILAKLLKDMSSLVAGVCGITCFILIGTILDLKVENMRLKGDVANRYITIVNLRDQVTDLENQIDNQTTEYEKLAEVTAELDSQNKELVDQINSQSAELEKLEELETRAELYNKYEYAITREDGTRTDITYDDIATLESLAEEKGMGEDAVDLVMAIAMTESDGIEDAKNPESTATGFGGLLKDTAKYIYETELGSPEGTYNHSIMAKDGTLNLKMSLCLVDFLAEENNRNPIRTVNDYRGLNDKSYINKINKYLAKVNKNLGSLKI